MQAYTNQGLPKSLNMLCSHMNNFSRSTFRLPSISNTVATSNQPIEITLPNNSVVDLLSLNMFFKGTSVGTGGTAGFPSGIELLIERIEYSVNNSSLGGGANNLNQYYKYLNDFSYGQEATSRRGLLQNSANGTAANVTGKQFAINNFLGFFGSAGVQHLNTSLVGDVKCRIYLTSAAALIWGSGTTAAEFTLSDIFFTIDVLSLPQMYYDMQRQFLSNPQHYYEIPYQNIYSTGQAITGGLATSTKWAVYTQSLDKVVGMYVYGNAKSTLDTTTTNSSYFTRLSEGITGWQFSVNSIFFPQFQPSVDQTAGLLTTSHNMNYETQGGWNPNLDTIEEWRSSYFVAEARFNLGGEGINLISGLNSSGTATNGSWQVNGTAFTTVTGIVQALVFAIYTSSLHIYDQQRVLIVQ